MSIAISAFSRQHIERFLDGGDPPTLWFKRPDGVRVAYESAGAYPREQGGCLSVPMRSNRHMAIENVVLRCRMLLARIWNLEPSALEFLEAHPTKRGRQ